MYWKIEPEVSTEFEDGTIMDISVHPPIVEKLSVRFEVWLGDDLLAMFPCFLVTERLKAAIEAAGLAGCSFDDVDVSKSPEFEELYLGRQLPKFFWMMVNGDAGKDDFGLGSDHRLVVSDRALKCLKTFNIDNCDVEECG